MYRARYHQRSSRSIGRAIHLIDIENLAGDPFVAAPEALTRLEQYRQIAQHGEGDLTVVAANRYLLDDIVFDMPFTALFRRATGRDGADLALLGEAPADWVCRRFSRLVIGSGDHLFTDLADVALASGLSVTVVGRRASVAAAYSSLGCEVRTLPDIGLSNNEVDLLREAA